MKEFATASNMDRKEVFRKELRKLWGLKNSPIPCISESKNPSYYVPQEDRINDSEQSHRCQCVDDRKGTKSDHALMTRKSFHSIGTLPSDILMQACFPYLGTIAELSVLMLVCTDWYSIARSDLLWQHLHRNYRSQVDGIISGPTQPQEDTEQQQGPLTNYTIVTSSAHFAALCATGRQVADQAMRTPITSTATPPHKQPHPSLTPRSSTLDINKPNHTIEGRSSPVIDNSHLEGGIGGEGGECSFYFACKEKHNDTRNSSEWEHQHGLGNVWSFVQSKIRVYFHSLVRRRLGNDAVVVYGQGGGGGCSHDVNDSNGAYGNQDKRPDGICGQGKRGMEEAGNSYGGWGDDGGERGGGGVYVLGTLRRAFSRLCAVNATSLRICLDRTFQLHADEVCRDIIIDIVTRKRGEQGGSGGGGGGSDVRSMCDIERRLSQYRVWHMNILLQYDVAMNDWYRQQKSRDGGYSSHKDNPRGGVFSGWSDEDDVVEGTLCGSGLSCGVLGIPEGSMDNVMSTDGDGSDYLGDKECSYTDVDIDGDSCADPLFAANLEKASRNSSRDHSVLLRRRVLNHFLVARFLSS